MTMTWRIRIQMAAFWAVIFLLAVCLLMAIAAPTTLSCIVVGAC